MTDMVYQKTYKRILSFDCLRILALFFMIQVHVSAQNWSTVDVISRDWKIFNFYNSIGRWTILVFTMISGALFLRRHHTIEKIIKKNVWKLVLAFLFWSPFYAIVSWLQGAEIREVIIQVFRGQTHMWYLFMIAGLYLIVPVLEKLTEDRKIIEYFLLLSLIFTFIIPQSITVLSVFSFELSEAIKTIQGYIGFHLTLGYVSYFILGYYLSTYQLSVKIRTMIYGLSFVGFITTILLSSWISVKNQSPSEMFYGAFTINILLESLGIFVLFQNLIPRLTIPAKLEVIIMKVSERCFGIYLVHIFVLRQLKTVVGLNTLSFHPLISVPVITIIVFILSYIIVAFISYIPFLGKKII